MSTNSALRDVLISEPCEGTMGNVSCVVYDFGCNALRNKKNVMFAESKMISRYICLNSWRDSSHCLRKVSEINMSLSLNKSL